MDDFKQKAREAWSRWLALNSTRKATWVAVGLSCIAVAGLFWYLAQPEYRVVRVGLLPEDAAAITAKLKAKGILYKLSPDGTTISVPSDQAAQIGIDLSGDGFSGGAKVDKGLDMFDQQGLGATPFNQHVNFLRAQQAEIARTIMQIDPIVYARVHIVRPEPSPFIRGKKATTASVMLKLRPHATLSRHTASAIATLVAGGVEGLTKENVRIIDANGRLLSEVRDPDTGLIGSFIEQRKEVEQYLASEAERVLAHVLGPGRAIVRVTAELNTKQMLEKKELIIAEGKVPTTEKTTDTKTTSTGTKGGGVAGTSAAFGKTASGPGGDSGSKSTTQTQESKWDYPRTTVTLETKLGSIERMTIAAFVDLSDPNGTEARMSLADALETVKKAVGFKTERDEIQVTEVRMPAANTGSFDEDYASHQSWQDILTIVRNVSIGMVALCAVVIAGVVVFRRARTALSSAATTAPEQEVKLQRITEELDRNPEVLTQLLSRWIDQSENSNRVAA